LPDNLHPYLFTSFPVPGTHGSCALSRLTRNIIAKLELKGTAGLSVSRESRATLVAKLELNVKAFVCTVCLVFQCCTHTISLL
jgi:hypothetical protein